MSNEELNDLARNPKPKNTRKRAPRVEGANSISEKFKRFHAQNPDVYDSIVRMARGLKRRGFEGYSISGIFEVIRYDRHLSTTGKPFKLANEYRSRYARLVMEQEPDLAGFFKTRELTSL